MRGTVRDLRRHPGFTATVVLTFALAVGVNTAVFSIANSLWFRPLPIDKPDRVVVAYTSPANPGDFVDGFSRRFQAAVEALDSFEEVTFELNTNGLMGDWAPVVRVAADAEPLRVRAVAHDYFRVLGVPIHGRNFRDEDDAPGATPVAILSQNFARRWFPNQSALGQRLATTRGPLAVAGVVGSGFDGVRLGDQVDIWIPLGGLGQFSEIAASGAGIQRLMPLTIVARLKDGIPPSGAQSEARTVLGPKVVLHTIRDVSFPLQAAGDLERQGALLKGLWLVAGLVLLLGCANIASLFAARTTERNREFSVRVFVGATPAHLVATVFIEVMVLALLGLAFGLFVRWVLITSMETFVLPSGLTVATLDPVVDWRVIAFALVITFVGATVAVSRAARHAYRAARGSSLVIDGNDLGTSRHLGHRLLILHVSLSVVLVVGAVALTTSLVHAYGVGFGFDVGETAFVSVRPRLTQYKADEDGRSARKVADHDRLVRRLRDIRGVVAVADGPVLLPVRDEPSPESQITADGVTRVLPLAVRAAGPEYLSTLGVRFVAGRDILAADERSAVDIGTLLKDPDVGRLLASGSPVPPRGAGPEGYPVAVIDTYMASTLWPDVSAVGKTFSHGFLNVTYQVVGVIQGIRHGALDDRRVPTLVTYARSDGVEVQGFDLALRIERGLDSTLGEIRSAILEVFPDPALLRIQSADAILAARTGRQKLVASLVSYCAVVSALLALVGIVGLVKYLIFRSRRELATRLALGATFSTLQAMVVRRVMTPVTVGVSVGALTAWILMKMLPEFIGASSPTLTVYGVAGVGFLATSCLSSVVSTLRIRRLQPNDAARVLSG
jgi:predicted permease